MVVGLVNKAHQTLNANVSDMAPSVAEADEILAKFGYTEAVLA